MTILHNIIFEENQFVSFVIFDYAKLTGGVDKKTCIFL